MGQSDKEKERTADRKREDVERCVLDCLMTLLLLHTLHHFDRIVNIHGI
jgi:hypothetical protein